jgi:phosphate acetyltransferase
MNVQAVDVGDVHPSKYDRLIAMAKAIPSAATLVVHPCDESSLRGVVEATNAGLIEPTLVGPAAKIKGAAAKHDIDISRFEIVDTPHSEAAAAKAVEMIHHARGELVMKGSLHTDELMRSVTAKTGLRTERRISHVFVMDVPAYAETLFITDAGSIFSRTSTASATSSRTRSISSYRPASAPCQGLRSCRRLKP